MRPRGRLVAADGEAQVRHAGALGPVGKLERTDGAERVLQRAQRLLERRVAVRAAPGRALDERPRGVGAAGRVGRAELLLPQRGGHDEVRPRRLHVAEAEQHAREVLPRLRGVRLERHEAAQQRGRLAGAALALEQRGEVVEALRVALAAGHGLRPLVVRDGAEHVAPLVEVPREAGVRVGRAVCVQGLGLRVAAGLEGRHGARVGLRGGVLLAEAPQGDAHIEVGLHAGGVQAHGLAVVLQRLAEDAPLHEGGAEVDARDAPIPLHVPQVCRRQRRQRAAPAEQRAARLHAGAQRRGARAGLRRQHRPQQLGQRGRHRLQPQRAAARAGERRGRGHRQRHRQRGAGERARGLRVRAARGAEEEGAAPLAGDGRAELRGELGAGRAAGRGGDEGERLGGRHGLRGRQGEVGGDGGARLVL